MSLKSEAEINAEKAAKSAIDVTPPELMLAAGRALGYGKAKHGVATSDGWGTWRVAGTQQAEPLTHYSCLMRHLLAWRAGEERDPESGLSHLDHAAAQLAILLDLLARPVESVGSKIAREALEAGRIKDPDKDEDWPLPEGWIWGDVSGIRAPMNIRGGQWIMIGCTCSFCVKHENDEARRVLVAREAARK